MLYLMSVTLVTAFLFAIGSIIVNRFTAILLRLHHRSLRVLELQPIRRTARRVARPNRFDTMPSAPSLHAWCASLSWGTRPDSQRPRRSATRRTEGAGTIQATEVFLAIIVKHREFKMDWNRVEGNWKQVKGKVKEKWGNLTDDDLTAINGQRDQLEGKIQERYGLAKDKVRKDVDDWYNTQTW